MTAAVLISWKMYKDQVKTYIVVNWSAKTNYGIFSTESWFWGCEDC